MVGTAKVTGTVRSKNPLKGAVEIIPERLYYAALSKLPPSHNILASIPKRKGKDELSSSATTTTATTEKGPKKQIHFFCIDNELVYWNFFLDFGPLNTGQLMRFSKKLNDKLRKFPAVCFYSNTVPSKRANAIFLICAWQMLYLDRKPEQAYAGFVNVHTPHDGSSFHYQQQQLAKHLEQQQLQLQQQQQTGEVDATTTTALSEMVSLPPVSQSQGAPTIAELPPFHDASPCQCTYELTVYDCLKGLQKAQMHNFFSLESFDVEEYEYFEQVENGDLNWIIPNKILAFAGPSYERHVSPEGYCTLSPSDYIPYFLQKNVSLVVRLNKKMYHEQDFINAGIDHIEAFFLDGSCPSMEILQSVLLAFEQVPEDKAFAVHCKAGLGRTGTCIGAYLMKHFGFTAKEAIAWMRICRPGCVIGPQQHYLEKIQKVMWEQGTAEGYIEFPTGESASTSSSCPTVLKVKDTEMSDAVIGRVGQADGLLQARLRRGAAGGASDATKNTVPPSIENEHGKIEFRTTTVVVPTSATTTAPMTPEVKEKGTIATVTPEHGGNSNNNLGTTSDPSALWCA